MTAHSSAVIVLRTEQLQQQGPSADLSQRHQATTAITQLCQRLPLQLNARLHLSHPQNPATKREEKSTDLLWWFFSTKQGFQRRKAMQWLWEVPSIKEIHFSLFGKWGAYNPARHILPLLAALVFFGITVLSHPIHAWEPCQVLHKQCKGKPLPKKAFNS